jgi:hypothetical protein
MVTPFAGSRYFCESLFWASQPKRLYRKYCNRPYGYRGLKIFTSLKLRFQDFQRVYKESILDNNALNIAEILMILMLNNKQSIIFFNIHVIGFFSSSRLEQ